MTLPAGPAGPRALTARTAPAWRSLMTVLRDAGSPPRRLLAECFPHDAAVRKAYRCSPPEAPVPSAGAPRTMGSAFDVWLQLQTAPRPALGAASAGARRCGPAVQAAYGLLLERLGPAEPAGAASGGPRPAVLLQWTGPSIGLTEPDLARLCWVSALLVEAYRAGMLATGSPLAQLPSQPAPEQSGRPVDLPELRARWRRMLVDEQPAGLRTARAGRPRLL